VPIILQPITANTPVVATPLPGLASDKQNTFEPKTSRLFNVPIPQRMRALRLRGGQVGTIDWQMLDNDGTPLDLRDLGFTVAGPPGSLTSEALGPHARFRIRENMSLGRSDTQPLQTEFSAYVTDPATGLVQINLTATLTAQPGIYFGEVGIFDGQDNLIFSNVFYVNIERGQFAGALTCGGPPTIAEIRLHLRDNGAAEHLLLKDVIFDDAEIALAISRPIMQFNEIQPVLDLKFNTQNFPSRYHWMEAIAGNLYLMLADWYRQNQLAYQAGGLALDDMRKADDYDRAAMMRMQTWNTWAQREKIRINLEGAYLSMQSPYALPF
jgi:hypothetical protein